MLDGGLYYGALGAAGEVGHQTIGLGTEVLQTRWLELDEVVEACPCGGHGVHWENVCDAQGFLALAAHLDPVAYERFSDGSSRPSSVDRFTAFIANVAGGLADTSQGPDTSEALRSYCDRLVRTYAEALAIGMSNLVNVLDVEQLVLTGRVVTTLKDVEWPVGAPPITDFRKHLRDTLRSVILRDHLPVLEYQDVAWSDLWKGAALATRDTRYSHLMLGTAGTRP